jgi:DNA-binding transcriptional LysR family regulator
MNLQDIEAFVAVAETGSVNRAAARLNRTQPATTRRIQNFEAAVGDTPLFNRSVKPAVLTSFGLHVLEHCRRVLTAVAELEACSIRASDPAGSLKAGVAHGLGEIVLTSPLDALRKAFPRLRLQISSNWSTGLIEEVRSGALDCAVGLLTDAHSIPAGMVRITLGPEQVVIVSASRPPTRHDGKPWQLHDLAGESWFLNPLGCGCRDALVRAFDRLQIPIQIAAEILGEDLQLSLIGSSGGVGLVPRRLFEHSPRRHGLQILSVQDFVVTAHVSLVRMAAPRRFDPVIGLLVDELGAKLRQSAFSA